MIIISCNIFDFIFFMFYIKKNQNMSILDYNKEYVSLLITLFNKVKVATIVVVISD